jgi:hypothetical protein
MERDGFRLLLFLLILVGIGQVHHFLRLAPFRPALVLAIGAVGYAFLNRGAGQALYSGRPDIVVEVYEKGADTRLPHRVLLGEIKYTESEQTFARGLRELLEYTRFARIGDTYLHEAADIDVGGLLITDGVAAANVEGTIRHLVAAELSARDEAVAALLGQGTDREHFSW